MSDYTLSTSVLTPDETDNGVWVAVVEGWRIHADNRQHAERIIDVCKMTMTIRDGKLVRLTNDENR